jgi:2-iminobutanoate/2-iminopropanoate deaminase
MKKISTTNAPQAIGPYSQAIVTNGLVFCSGQIPLDPNGNVVTGDVKDQVKQVMENLKAVLTEAGTEFGKVVKTTIYLTDIADFPVVNEIYGSYFVSDIKPARATVQVAALPKSVKVEIDCIAEV